MSSGMKSVGRGAIIVAAVLAIGGGGWLYWNSLDSDLPPGFARANGRIEATRIDVAVKFGGRIAEVLVEQGTLVETGAVVARIEATEIEAQLRAAKAALRQTHQELLQTEALIAQRKGEQALARAELERTEKLVERGYTTSQSRDIRRSQTISADAAVTTAQAQRRAVEAAVEAAEANIAVLQSRLSDHVLTAPRGGRVQYRLAEPGEIVPAGGKVLTLLDLTNVYMDVYLPTDEAGLLQIGAEARLILDPAPQYVVPATVTFVASEAQFTPKYVETESERAKLMFRVKLTIDAKILRDYQEVVKTGIPGIAVVRIAPDAIWPAELSVNLP